MFECVTTYKFEGLAGEVSGSSDKGSEVSLRASKTTTALEHSLHHIDISSLRIKL